MAQPAGCGRPGCNLRNFVFRVVFGSYYGIFAVMKRWGNWAVVLAGGLVLITGAQATATPTQGNPYEGIIERNVFGLKEPPKAGPPPEPPKPPPPKITLQGIHYLLGHWQVLFKAPAPVKPGEPPKGDLGYVLSEGERDGEVEVLKIDGKEGKVTFMNHGQQQVLSMDRDAEKPVAGAVVTAPTPGVLPVAGAPVTTFAAPTPVAPTPATFGGTPMTTVPSRTIRQPPPYSGVMPISPGGTPGQFPPSATINVGGGTPGTSTLGGMSTPGIAAVPQVQQAQQPQMTPEEQTVLIELNRQLTAKEVMAGELPPLPPTPLTPPDAPGAPGVPVGRGLAPQ